MSAKSALGKETFYGILKRGSFVSIGNVSLPTLYDIACIAVKPLPQGQVALIQ